MRRLHVTSCVCTQFAHAEEIARALAAGRHRGSDAQLNIGDAERERRTRADAQDAEAVRLLAYTGLRRAELVALRWKDVDRSRSKLTVTRALSAGIEGAPKSGHFRDVAISDQAATALDRLAARDDFTEPNDLALCNALGRHLDPTALGRRYNRAREPA
jgi:integrase